ncbi:peptidoglycan DD-metalloendopeptidase family protein [Acutalibacter intestini]|uniref:peptidoglycan DD-metalloendopeptidase family protein n=1 Tax=Acutalibacter intestini TaxID=3093659 RepID=UPI002AC8CA1E|nr:lysozyme family protein [Acutalibacter sp. M00204]
MSDDLQTRDKQNRDVDSSEQYAINVIGNRSLQSANLLMKESKRTVEKALAGKSVPRQFERENRWTSPITPRQAPTAETVPPDRGVHTPTKASKQQEENFKPVSSEPHGQHHTERQDHFFSIADDVPGENVQTDVEPVPFSSEEKSVAEETSAPATSKSQRCSAPQKAGHHQKDTSPRQTKRNLFPAKVEDSPHMQAEDNNLHLSEESSITTWENSALTNSLQNQGAALRTAETSGAALQTFQAAGQSAGNAGASAAANAAAPGVGAVIQAPEKAAAKIKETVESIAASASHSSSSLGALAALFLIPLLIIAAIVGALRGGGSARNVGLSDDVLALMPQISAACQANGIPEYAPLVAAVIMQESGGRVADVGGDVMQCAEGMGLPVGTPVSLEESINFGTSIIAANLQLAGAAGPTDIPAISLALQGYNFGNGYISWALSRDGYSKKNAREFSQMQAAAHGWSGYGDIDYVDHVLRYYQVSTGGMGDISSIADGRFAYPFPGHSWDTYPGHNGIDISFANCYGEPVYAVAAGTVRYTQDGWTPAHGVGGMWSFGNSVFIEHGDGWISAYGHLSALAVTSGEAVTQGQLIGYIGNTGNSTGPHLHLALYHNGDAGIGGQNFAELAWPQNRLF